MYGNAGHVNRFTLITGYVHHVPTLFSPSHRLCNIVWIDPYPYSTN
jgi:hypothetical protein